MGTNAESARGLQVLDSTEEHVFREPMRKIINGADVTFFETSKAYVDIMTFILQLNASMFPQKLQGPPQDIQVWELDSKDVTYPPSVTSLAALLDHIGTYIDKAPPDTGPRRFGNISFRRWYELVEEDAFWLLENYLPALRIDDPEAKTELCAYLLGSFGSGQRLDYGTGHELSFLAFLAGIWKLGGFAPATTTSSNTPAAAGATERAIVLGVLQPYLELIRRLIKTYTLEPAGSHGVWGLDDHAFLPYIFGSAQLGPPASAATPLPTEGSLPTAPDPGAVANENDVVRLSSTNMYFSAVAFIHAVKKGPFWEHSPMLYDISGVRGGWAKINKGMLKMYAAEVLAKFPVVQHFPFGGLFAWERDPAAVSAAGQSAHVAAQPAPLRDEALAGTAAPWASAGAGAAGAMPATRAPWAGAGAGVGAGAGAGAAGMPPTRAPWAGGGGGGGGGGAGGPAGRALPPMGPTRAPWARKDG